MRFHRLTLAVTACAVLSVFTVGAEPVPVDAGTIGLSTSGTAEQNSRVLEGIGDNTTVFVPPGSYKIKQTTFSRKSNIRIVGAGPASRLIIEDSKYGIVIARSSGITLENLFLGGTSRVALYIYESSSIKVLKNKVTGATKAESGPMAGIELLGVSDIRIEGNTLMGNGDGREAESYEIVAWAGARSSRVQIRNNTIVGTGTHKGIGLFSAADSEIIGNHVNQGNVGNRANSGYGVFSYGTGKPNSRINVSGNVIENTSGSGIYCANSRELVLSGNRIRNTGSRQDDATLPVGAISLNTVDNASIRDNLISESHATAISLSTVSAIRVHGNTISNPMTRRDLNFPVTIHLRNTASDVEFAGNTVQCNAGICIDYAIPSLPMKGIKIDNNALDGAGTAIRLGKFDDAVVSNNRISSYRQTGVRIDSGIRAVITGNTFSGSKASALDVRSDTRVEKGNIVR